MNSPRARWFAKTILVALSVLPLLVVSRDVDIHLGEAQRKAEKKELIASCQDANARSATDKWSNCWTYKYEPDKCTYLYNGDGEGARSTGDEGSFFLNSYKNVTCFLYSNGECDPKDGISDGFIDNGGRGYSLHNNWEAHAFKCLPQNSTESLDLSAIQNDDPIHYCGMRDGKQECHRFNYEQGKCLKFELPLSKGNIIQINERAILCVAYGPEDCSGEGGPGMSHAVVLNGPNYWVQDAWEGDKDGKFNSIMCVPDLICTQTAIDAGSALCQ